MPSKNQLSFLLLIGVLAQVSRSEGTSTVEWMSPSAGDIFGPGDTIIGKWKSAKTVVSPFFRLCASGDSDPDKNATNNCGTTIWPTVNTTAGMNFVSLAVPDVDSDEDFYLRMEDDFGKVTLSPAFSLSPNPKAASSANSSLPIPPSGGVPVAQSPLSQPTAPGAVVAPAASSAIPAPNSNPQLASTGAPSILNANRPPPTAAYAVPISLVGAIIIVTGIISLQHHRKLIRDREQEAAKLSRSSSASSYKSAASRRSDLEYALGALARDDMDVNAKYGPAPVPMYIKRESRPRTRESTRQAFAQQQVFVDSSTKYRRQPPSLRVDCDDAANASVNHSVISDYFQPSPIPPPLASPLPLPERLYVRREAEPETRFPNPYSYEGKTRPSSPEARETRDVYDAIANVTRR